MSLEGLLPCTLTLPARELFGETLDGVGGREARWALSSTFSEVSIPEAKDLCCITEHKGSHCGGRKDSCFFFFFNMDSLFH